MKMVRKIPNPVDKHIGSRIRMRRMMLQLSQEKLGDALGLTFQQVQKYEKGTNRVGGSRMQQIAHILKVPVGFFYEGAPMLNHKGVSMVENASESPTYVNEFLATSEGLATAKAMMRITDGKTRRRFVDLIEEVSLMFNEQSA